MLSLSGPPAPMVDSQLSAPSIRSSTGGPGPVFCLRHPKARPAYPAGPIASNSTPQRFTWAYSGPFFRPCGPVSRPELPVSKADKSSTRALTGGRSARFGTHLGGPAGPKTHSRRTGRKLGQIRCARQGLVRVPESNTKYGGKRGITGGDPAPVIGPSISESSGIPKEKNCSGHVERRLLPLFTGQVFIRRRASGIALWRLT